MQKYYNSIFNFTNATISFLHFWLCTQSLTSNIGSQNNHVIRNELMAYLQWWQTAPAAVKNLNISFKCCSKYKSMDSFEICLSWGFQNTPNMLKLIEFWLRYLRSKTNDMILKNSSKLIEIDENLMKTKLFVTKIILVTLGGINVNKNHFWEANEMFWMLNWLLKRQNV